MRINAVFSKKVSTAQFENETYTVTVEAESEFNNIAEVSDYLFNQARAAVQRQIGGVASGAVPQTKIPDSAKPNQGGEQRDVKGGSVLPVTEKQTAMLRKLLRENFKNAEDETDFLYRKCGIAKVEKLSRRQASRIIEALMDMRRNVA